VRSDLQLAWAAKLEKPRKPIWYAAFRIAINYAEGIRAPTPNGHLGVGGDICTKERSALSNRQLIKAKSPGSPAFLSLH
jgi:hypothetical protein